MIAHPRARESSSIAAERQSIPVNNATGNVARAAAPTYRSSRVTVRDVGDESRSTHATVIDSRSKPNYVGIVIHGFHGSHAALHDSGSEVHLINRELVEQLSNLRIYGTDTNRRCSWTSGLD